jgi:hypothetical protein
MEKVEKYRKHAEECMQLAETMPREAREKLLQIASAWLELAGAELKVAEAAETQPSKAHSDA